MDCTTCSRAIGSESLPFHCATCARVTLYPHRKRLLEVRTDHELHEKRVVAVVQGDEKGERHYSIQNSLTTVTVDREKCTTVAELEQTKAETVLVKERTAHINEHALLLRQQIELTNKELATRKAALAQRRSDLQSAGHNIDSRRANELDKVQQSIKKAEYRWNKRHHETVEARRYLCKEAAKLSGLKLKRRKTKDGGSQDVYFIGPGELILVIDLRDLNNASWKEITASMTAVAQLVVRVSHYLSVRLPAEITLPHREYPLPTIFSPSSSYQSREVPFPGSSPTPSTSNSPDASRNLEQHRPLPRPRALFIDFQLMDLATQDPQAYAMFLEGVSLLAYDVAWLCRTQGMQDDFNAWEDVCSMGKNLYRLLIQQDHRPFLGREPSSKRDIAAGNTINPTETLARPSKPRVEFGEFSHGTAHSFLGSAENASYLRGWKLTPPKIVDSLKAMLLADQQVQGWEMLDQKEWHGMDDMIAEEPVLIGPKRKDTGFSEDTRSVLSVATTAAATTAIAETEDAGGQGKARGVNGWTKLKSRTSDGLK